MLPSAALTYGPLAFALVFGPVEVELELVPTASTFPRAVVFAFAPLASRCRAFATSEA